jgi:hypothetical protein
MLYEPSTELVPSAMLRVPVLGVNATVRPGSLIGRLITADLSLSDPRVSEAHALVSWRHRSLKVLALRGPLIVDGQELDAVELLPNTTFELAEGLSVVVESVETPTHTLMLCGAAPGAVEIRATVYSLILEPEIGVRVLLGFVDSAIGHVWYSGTRPWIRIGKGPAEPLSPGGQWNVAGRALRVIRVPLDDTADTWTERQRSHGGFTLFARYSSVHLQRADGTAVITGKPANLLSELVRFGNKPVPWDVLSRQIWGESIDRSLLRKNFDSTLARLRAQLRELGMREDLVGLDGGGNIEIVLHAGDRTVDQT